MSTIDFRTAICEALDEELARDESVLVFGEDVAAAGGVWATTPTLLERHGSERVFDTPISELALAGAAFGSALCGKRPVIEIMFGDFLMLAMDSLVNQAAKWWYVSNEQASVPLVVRAAVGAGLQFGAVHSQMPISWFLGVPGLKIVCPSTPGDAKGLLKQSIRDNNPVLFLEHKRLYSMTGESTQDVIPIGVAKTVRAGRDITLVSAMRGVHDCLAAAEELASSGIEAEVIDLRTLRPLDMSTVIDSLKRTHRLLVVEEGPRTGGWSGEVLARTLEDALEHVDIAWRLATPDTPIPYAQALEDAFLPSRGSIVASVKSHLDPH